jgi:uncharacterized Fe-S cluster-containing radical SAM superfamily protein
VRLQRFRELWIHTGSTCNLSCPFCHEGSSPGDQRIPAPPLAQVVPWLEQAAAAGVERFAFTGGEPLIHREIVPIVQAALALRPVLVLTNGTAPLVRRPHHLALWRAQPHALTLRVSIDFPDEAQHDAGRGLKNFRKAMEGLKLLHSAGFSVGITRQQRSGEDSAAIEARFRTLLRRQALPTDMPIIALPELGMPQAEGAVVAAMPPLSSADPVAAPACTRSRMLLQRADALSLMACPLVDDAPRFDLGADLDVALQADVLTDHPRCRACLQPPGVPYAG